MPIVIPGPSNATSAAQTVATQTVFDYVLDTQGRAVKGLQVVITLAVGDATTISPMTELSNALIRATTDSNGYWSVALIPNANISPTNSTYSVQVPGLDAYSISIPASGGPFQSTSPSVLVNQPGVLAPATTGITGSLSVSGNETVAGSLSVSGTTTLGPTTAGALTAAATGLGATTVSGDLTIGSAFRLLLLAAASRIVPGVTSLSLRNNADTQDNVLVTDAGVVTVRGGLTVTAGDIVVGAGRLLLNVAAAKIKGGATSLSIRNNADTQDNLLVSDAGAVTVRNGLTVSAGGASISGHILSTGPTPTLGTLKTGVSSQSISGSDNYAKVSITTSGSPPAAGAAIFDLVFASTWGVIPSTAISENGTGVVWAATASNATSGFSAFHGGTSAGVAALGITTNYIYACQSGGPS